MKEVAAAFIRDSPSLRYAAKSVKASLHHWRLSWRAQRRSFIRSYLSANETRKLQIGCGELPLAGWLNTDLDPGIAPSAGSEAAVIYLDATQRFPLADGTFDYIYAEHVIEHVTFEMGRRMLRESHRGECGYKLLQYAAAGTPVVGSPIGVNERLLAELNSPAATNEDEWVDAMLDLLTRPSTERERLGRAGRELVERQYSYDAWLPRWLATVGIGDVSSKSVEEVTV